MCVGLAAFVFLSGTHQFCLRLFFALDGLAAAISIPVWVVGAWYLADNLEEALHFAKEMHMVLLIALPTMVVGYLIYKYIKKKRRPSST